MSKESEESLTGLKAFFEKRRKQKETIDSRYFVPKVWLFEPRPGKKGALARIDDFNKVSLSNYCAGLSFSSAKTASFKAIDQVERGYIYTDKRLSTENYIDMLVPSASVLDIAAFLRVKEGDIPVYQHILNDSEQIKLALDLEPEQYERLRVEVQKLCEKTNTRISTRNQLYTHYLVPQVYFPTDLKNNEFIVVTPLPPISLLNEVKKFVHTKLHGIETEVARKAFFSRKPHEDTVIGFNKLVKLKYGGSQPQNISALNNENTGRFIHLLCEAPSLNSPRIPKNNFFGILNKGDFQWNINALSNLVKSDYGNKKIREAITHHINQITDLVFLKVVDFNGYEAGWSDRPDVLLSIEQKYWLDNKYQEERKKNKEWMAEVSKDFSRWLIAEIEYNLKTKHLNIKLSNDDYVEIRNHFITALAKAIKFQLEYM